MYLRRYNTPLVVSPYAQVLYLPCVTASPLSRIDVIFGLIPCLEGRCPEAVSKPKKMWPPDISAKP
jgi:hypothetical protein